MTLQAGQYSMQCWNSTRNPNDMNRPKLIYQCLQLIKALQARFTNGEIAIPSRDQKETRQGVEICILYRPELPIFDDIASFLTRTASEKSLDYQEFVKQDMGVTRYFNDEEIRNVSLLAAPVPDGLTEDKIAEVAKSVTEYDGFNANHDWSNSIPAEQRATQRFQITRRSLQRLHEKEGQDLRGEISNLLDGFKAAQGEIKTAWQVIAMIAKGVVAVGGVGAIGGVLGGTVYCVFIVSVWVGVGFAVVIGAALLAIAAVLGFAGYLAVKDARNVLLLVNDTPSDIFPLRDNVRNGERKVVPEVIPATALNSDFVSASFFVYEKYKIAGQSFGSYGSAFGVSFKGGQGEFSVGMDCPNSFFGGNNSIEVCTGNDPGRAAQMALDSGCMHGWTDNPRVDVKIADHWGNVNWGRAIAMGK
ncbi:hypothetical protein SLS57_008186 [Botryosphaeria dothidea]